MKPLVLLVLDKQTEQKRETNKKYIWKPGGMKIKRSQKATIQLIDCYAIAKKNKL